MTQSQNDSMEYLRITIHTEGDDTVVCLRDDYGYYDIIAYLRAQDEINEPIGVPFAHHRPFSVVDITASIIPTILLSPTYGPPAVRWMVGALNRLRRIAAERNPAQKRHNRN